jgi:hypothetical protein
MKILVAVVMGFFSGCMLYLMAGFLSLAGASPESALRPILGVIGWAASAYGLLRGAQSARNVLTRGFLLGAAEWLVIMSFGLMALAIVGDGGIVRATVVADWSLFMALVCLAGFAMVHFWRREAKIEKGGHI